MKEKPGDQVRLRRDLATRCCDHKIPAGTVLIVVEPCTKRQVRVKTLGGQKHTVRRGALDRATA